MLWSTVFPGFLKEMKKTIKVFTANHCAPCDRVKELLEKGLVESDIDAELDLINIETEEGFKEIEKNDLTSIPAAFYEGRSCKLDIDEEREIAVITCNPTSEPGAEASS